jgi:hypothetical protein
VFKSMTMELLMLRICQVVSNGRFRSVEHRAVTNASTARISISTFYGPSKDAFIAPAASMVDGQHPALYWGYQFGDFMRVFWGQELKRKRVLDHFKIEYPEDNREWILFEFHLEEPSLTLSLFAWMAGWFPRSSMHCKYISQRKPNVD